MDENKELVETMEDYALSHQAEQNLRRTYPAEEEEIWHFSMSLER